MDVATLQKMHPSWNIVDYKVAPNGGIWAVGSDGGVFSLDSSGGQAGTVAPYLGSYTGLDEKDRQAGVGFGAGSISVNQYGGFTLTNVNQQNYEFRPKPTLSPVTAPPPVDTTGTTQATGTAPPVGESLSASAAIHAVFDPLGLGGLADAALTYMNSKPGATPDYITNVWLPDQDIYKQTFPEIAKAQAQIKGGQNVAIPTPSTILSYRQAGQQMVAQGLLPPELASNDKIGDLILGGVSLGEFENRVMKGWADIRSAPDDLAAFLAYHPGLDASHAVATLLDPTLGDVAAQNAITQAEIGGAATRSGFGGISAEQATSLQQAGLSGTSAQSALARESALNPLTQNLAGETDQVTRDTLIGDVANDATSQQAVQRRLGSRQAQFQGGGGAGTSGSGGTGLGSS